MFLEEERNYTSHIFVTFNVSQLESVSIGFVAGQRFTAIATTFLSLDDKESVIKKIMQEKASKAIENDGGADCLFDTLEQFKEAVREIPGNSKGKIALDEQEKFIEVLWQKDAFYKNRGKWCGNFGLVRDTTLEELFREEMEYFDMGEGMCNIL